MRTYTASGPPRRVGLGLLFCALVACSIAWAALAPSPAHAAINKRVNFQGQLTDPSGNPVADGSYNMEFKLHDDPTAAGGGQGACTGSCLWLETRTGGSKVTVFRGHFSVQLGEVASLVGFDFNRDPVYLSMRIGGTAVTPVWDTEMTPRHRLGSAPQSIYADVAGAVNAAKPAGSAVLTNNLTGSDPNAAVRILGDGRIDWGPGGASAPDTNLYRNGVGSLRTDGAFSTGGAISATGAITTGGALTATGNVTSSAALRFFGGQGELKLVASGSLSDGGSVAINSVPGRVGLLFVEAYNSSCGAAAPCYSSGDVYMYFGQSRLGLGTQVALISDNWQGFDNIARITMSVDGTTTGGQITLTEGGSGDGLWADYKVYALALSQY